MERAERAEALFSRLYTVATPAGALRIFARLMAWRAAGGLCAVAPRAELPDVLRRHFPQALDWADELDGPTRAETLPQRADEVIDVVELLREFQSAEDPDASWVAHVVAEACLEEDHLWQDLGLETRGQLGELLETHFASLARRNTQDMKWKRFLYKQLCDREQVPCRAPSCAVCTDFAKCFGPEDGRAPIAWMRPEPDAAAPSVSGHDDSDTERM
ncbi:nitrogen fixation protein NifQ [Plasticicumulans acidivorans]|uniref:Nitrogen fixation protein NifQ n=1 Tax=Plasticicumulans acidivorans TaxID=886464 RepID=A0A317MQG2_9GAMM|nr:nitrogen fixation protein NifQ [Plasticicumulans acidivorans]PWV58616.1 nitrogen fixation protein NifQ [Plasticicumulans acidivorans]